MIDGIIDMASKARYDKVLDEGAYCPKCGDSITLPNEFPAGGMDSQVGCASCGWLGSLNKILSMSLADRVVTEQPERGHVVSRSTASGKEWELPARKQFNQVFYISLTVIAFVSLMTVAFSIGGATGSDGEPASKLLVIALMIPFWLFSLGMMFYWYWTQFSVVSIVTDHDSISMKRHVFGKLWEKRIPVVELEDIDIFEYVSKKRYIVTKMVGVVGANSKFMVASWLEDEEKAWLKCEFESAVEMVKSTMGVVDERDDPMSFKEINTKYCKLKAIDINQGHFVLEKAGMYVKTSLFIAGLLIVVLVALLNADQYLATSADGVLGTFGRMISFMGLLLPVILFCMILGLLVMAFWSWKRVEELVFDNNGLTVTTSWRGNKRKKSYPAGSFDEVLCKQVGQMKPNKHSKFSVTLMGMKRLNVLYLNRGEIAKEVEKWLRYWITKQ